MTKNDYIYFIKFNPFFDGDEKTLAKMKKKELKDYYETLEAMSDGSYCLPF